MSLDPNQQDYWNNKGNTERQLGDLAAAERSLRKGLQLLPEQVSLLLNLAQVLQERGETVEVRALAERAVKVHRRRDANFNALLCACLTRYWTAARAQPASSAAADGQRAVQRRQAKGERRILQECRGSCTSGQVSSAVDRSYRSQPMCSKSYLL